MRLAVTGDKIFLDRHRGLIHSLASNMESVVVVPSGNLMELFWVRVCSRLTRGTLAQKYFAEYVSSLNRRILGFRLRSRETERRIGRLAERPDLVLHVFGSFAPFWRRKDIPYAMYLDFTMALALQQWPPWADFPSEAAAESWIAVENDIYRDAAILFTMGSNAKTSLISQYGISASKIHVVGSGADFGTPRNYPKAFGNKRLLFYASEFDRKGGDVVLEAFDLIRRDVPSARLTIIGNTIPIDKPGVDALGYVYSRETIDQLFQESDLVLAPSRCDPFPTFVIEAMNCGVPCIVTKISGISEVFTGGLDELLVEKSESRALADVAVRNLSNPKHLEMLSVRAKRIVSSHLNWVVVARKIVSHLDKLNTSLD